jgi:hypothetical protein
MTPRPRTPDEFRASLTRMLKAALDAVLFAEPTIDDKTLDRIDNHLRRARELIHGTQEASFVADVEGVPS